ncbi:MAG: hypothetical protein KGS48_05355 [Bacteroidetes bacterium]|nr:hypothetical protein [Bacteroidota bacterium]
MFTINIYLRFALMAIGIVGGLILSFAFGFWYGFPFILVGTILLIGYLLLGTILSTNQFIAAQQLDQAEARLKLTFFPKLLLLGYKGVYFMTKGSIELQRRNFVEAEQWIKMAIVSGLPSDNEKGAALMQMVMISAAKNNKQAALNQMNELKKLKITEPALKEQVKEIEKQMKQMQQAGNNPSMLGMMGGKGFRPGSKRRTPRMR